ncbi:hypothetical protein ACG33_01080 [Steroidobacter denitrificans]|uniref:NodB homology domain-containing protein n=1 Tax=Steroidobacter denitrificans TaxID=465721 RepID=A0A127F836_STEDE|nr:polysaccharide deacetylase family protein [Steroidobacter denitrificans]AMN45720.1 hypothetical protein ACG33_01080 [Steroidobacter denitrificans]
MPYAVDFPRVYLSFDDGPDREWTPRILDMLEEVGMRATFFMIGRQAQRAPELVRRIAADGHAVGNHTYSHRHPWSMGECAARAEVRDGANALSELLGQPPRLYRPPYGRQRTCMSEQARTQGERLVLWNLSAVDWGPWGTAGRIRRRLAHVRENDVVLMHDGRNRHNRPDELGRMLPGFLRALAHRGLCSCSLS